MTEAIEQGLESSGSEYSSASPASQESGAPAPFFDPNPVYDKVGSMYRESKALDPIFEEYNKKYEAEMAKYQPYEPFFSEDPQKLAAAITLFDKIDSPEGAREIYDGIARLLNITPAEAKQVVKEVQEEQDGSPDEQQEPQQPVEDPRMAEFENYIQQQKREKAVSREESVIDTEWAKIVQADPSLAQDQVRREHLMNRVYALVQLNDGKVPLPQHFQQAYREQQTYNQNLYDSMNAQPGRQAPQVMSPTGSNPGSGVNPADRDEFQRKSAFAQRLREELSSQG